jgi:hypothetical protein
VAPLHAGTPDSFDFSKTSPVRLVTIPVEVSTVTQALEKAIRLYAI